MNKLFDQIEGFSENEPWGKPDKMSGLTVMALEHIRKWFRNKHGEHVRIVLHAGYEESGHAVDSQHDWDLRKWDGEKIGGKVGNAVDFHIEGLDMSFNKQVSEMLECLGDLQLLSVVGLGIYPDWNNKGYHLDTRGHQARWGRIGNKYVTIGEALAHAVGKEGAG